VVEATLSAAALRPKVVVVWILLLALVGAIMAIELSEPRDKTDAELRERMLLPLPIEQLGAIELAHAGSLHRFERDASGSWFYHGIHTAAQSAHEHQIDPVVSARIEQRLAGLGRAVVERQFEAGARSNDYGVASPSLLILAYRPNEALPLVQYAVGDLAPDGQSRYLQAVGTSRVVMVANYQIDNLLELLAAISTSSTSQAGITPQPRP
jgi:hypothetical protein